MIQINDNQEELNHSILKDHIDDSAEFQELILDSRCLGRKNFTFLHECDIMKLNVLLNKHKERCQVFSIPYHLK